MLASWLVGPRCFALSWLHCRSDNRAGILNVAARRGGLIRRRRLARGSKSWRRETADDQVAGMTRPVPRQPVREPGLRRASAERGASGTHCSEAHCRMDTWLQTRGRAHDGQLARRSLPMNSPPKPSRLGGPDAPDNCTVARACAPFSDGVAAGGPIDPVRFCHRRDQAKSRRYGSSLRTTTLDTNRLALALLRGTSMRSHLAQLRSYSRPSSQWRVARRPTKPSVTPERQ